MNANQLMVGEFVAATVQGRVDEVRVDHGRTMVVLRYGDDRTTVNLGAAAVEVARVASWQWPPVDGDVWADRTGREWFAWLVPGDADRPAWVELISAPGEDHRPLHGEAWDVLQQWGPMWIRRRRGMDVSAVDRPGGGLEPTAGQLLTRVERGVREEGLPCPKSIDLHAGSAQLVFPDGHSDAVDGWAAFLRLLPGRRTGAPYGPAELRTQVYEASAAAGRLWPGWAVTVWCSVLADPPLLALPAGEDGAEEEVAEVAGELVEDGAPAGDVDGFDDLTGAAPGLRLLPGGEG